SGSPKDNSLTALSNSPATRLVLEPHVQLALHLLSEQLALAEGANAQHEMGRQRDRDDSGNDADDDDLEDLECSEQGQLWLSNEEGEEEKFSEEENRERELRGDDCEEEGIFFWRSRGHFGERETPLISASLKLQRGFGSRTRETSLTDAQIKVEGTNPLISPSAMIEGIPLDQAPVQVGCRLQFDN
ncbi:hypothetical protein BDK51DRAFT_30454, partial [Blyttiomyces helicus]